MWVEGFRPTRDVPSREMSLWEVEGNGRRTGFGGRCGKAAGKTRFGLNRLQCEQSSIRYRLGYRNNSRCHRRKHGLSRAF